MSLVQIGYYFLFSTIYITTVCYYVIKLVSGALILEEDITTNVQVIKSLELYLRSE